MFWLLFTLLGFVWLLFFCGMMYELLTYAMKIRSDSVVDQEIRRYNNHE